MKRYLLVICLLFPVIVLFAQRSLPPVAVADLQGNRYEISAILNDSLPVVLAFWSTTCKPCIQELDALNEVFDEWKEIVDFKIVAVATDDSRASVKVRPMVKGREWHFLVLLDKNQDLKRAMNVSGIPFLFVLDGNGKVVYSHNGYTPGAETEVLKILKRLKP